MKFGVFILLLGFQVILGDVAAAQSDVRPSILAFADTAASWTELQEYQQYPLFDDSATVNELSILSGHPSPNVRYYALRAFGKRSDSTALSTLIRHLSDTSRVVVGGGDIYDQGPLCWFVANNILEGYFLRSRATETQYEQIRNLAEDTIVSAATIGLARFHRPGDLPLLEKRINQMLFMQKVPPGGQPYYPYYALATIREFPAGRFFPILRKALTLHQSDATLIQAVVQYKTEAALQLLRGVLRDSKADHLWRSKVDIVVALLRYPDYYFRPFEEEVTLDLRSFRIAQRMAAEEF